MENDSSVVVIEFSIFLPRKSDVVGVFWRRVQY